jgi:hypothetical protein
VVVSLEFTATSVFLHHFHVLESRLVPLQKQRKVEGAAPPARHPFFLATLNRVHIHHINARDFPAVVSMSCQQRQIARHFHTVPSLL